MLLVYYYYKLKDGGNLDEVIEFVKNNKSINLHDLLSNNIDLSLVDNFINDYLGNKRL